MLAWTSSCAAAAAHSSEVIRDAVDAYLDDAAPDSNHALECTFGALPQLEAPPRDEWTARERRIRRG